jgi:hypothetical protein
MSWALLEDQPALPHDVPDADALGRQRLEPAQVIAAGLTRAFRLAQGGERGRRHGVGRGEPLAHRQRRRAVRVLEDARELGQSWSAMAVS